MENTNSHTIQGFNPAETIFSHGFGFGCADLIQGGPFDQAIGRTVCVLLFGIKDREGNSPFNKMTIILPPANATKLNEDSVLDELIQAFTDLRGTGPSKEEILILRQKLNVVNARSLEVSSLLEILKEKEKHSFIAVADAQIYRDFDIEQAPVFGVTAMRAPEDQWAPHVASICRQFMPVLKELEGYALIHSASNPAYKDTNIDLLNSIDDCYVCRLGINEDPIEKVSARMSIWKAMVVQGRFSEVDEESRKFGLTEETRIGLLAQLLQGAGDDSKTIEIVGQLLPYLEKLHDVARIKLARIAHNAGDDDLAKEFLPAGPNEVKEQTWLEEALDIFTQFEDNAQIALFDKHLSELFPNSERLRENRDRRLLWNCNKGNSRGNHLFTTTGFTENHLFLQEKLSGNEPDYQAVLEAASNWGKEWLEFAGVACAMHAQSVGMPIEAANVASEITVSELYGRQATQILLWSLRAMLLREMVLADSNDYYRPLVNSVLTYLAQNPQDSEIRAGLMTLLSVESSGTMGIPLVALAMMDFAEAGVQIANTKVIETEVSSGTQNPAAEESMRNVITWLSEQGAAEPGVTVVPREILVADPDEVVRLIESLIDYGSKSGKEEMDLPLMQQFVLALCAICPHATTERNQDIRLLRHLACTMAAEGYVQQARNLAETLLLMGQIDAYRRRLAWQAFADIYHRCRNYTLALVGMACAGAVDVSVEKGDLWHEVYTMHRVLRDLTLLEQARSLLPSMKSLLSDLGHDPERNPMYLNAELGIEVMLEKRFIADELFERIVEVCQRELGVQSRLLPLAMLLGQAVLKAQSFGQAVPNQAQAMWNTVLAKLGPDLVRLVKTVSAIKPNASDVLTMFKGMERAAYAKDAASDFGIFEQSVRRLLDSSESNDSAANVNAFATELLADHTVNSYGEPPAMTLDWARQYAEKLNGLGMDVAFLALDSQGELVVTHVGGGGIRTVGQAKEDKSFRHRFLTWLQDYPRLYGKADPADGNNVFFTSMEKLNVSLPKSEKLVLVAEPFLQQLTANLVVVHPEDGSFSYFIGTETAIGTVPSLSWLFSSENTKRTGKTACKAWISAEDSDGFDQSQQISYQGDDSHGAPSREPTLDVALRRLRGVFEDYDFSVDTGRRLPRGMADASIAVITAHGGLKREGRFLHSISDDDKLLETPSSLAAVLASVELVILFVCSGGRIDKNPMDNSTTSLPKQLLNKGCRAVIASPWPLHVMVTYNWLPAFMREWNAGATVVEATRKANGEVARSLGEAPQYALAMRVYGDVLLKKYVSKNVAAK